MEVVHNYNKKINKYLLYIKLGKLQLKFMTSFSLKMLALVTMIIDHIGAVFFPNYFIFRYIGRFAFPIYAFFIAQGIKNTKNIKKYLRDLFIVALISEIFFDLCFFSNIPFFAMNTVFTLFLGAFSIYLYNKSKNCIYKYLFLFLGLILSDLLNTDYSIFGIILIYIFYFINDKKLYIFYGILLCTLKNINNLYNIVNNFIKYSYLTNKYYYRDLFLYIFTIIPFFIIPLYNGKKGKNIKYLFYIFYPLHLILIIIIKFFIKYSL